MLGGCSVAVGWPLAGRWLAVGLAGQKPTQKRKGDEELTHITFEQKTSCYLYVSDR